MLYIFEVTFEVVSTGEVLTRGEWAGRESSAKHTIEDAYGEDNVKILEIKNLSKEYKRRLESAEKRTIRRIVF